MGNAIHDLLVYGSNVVCPIKSARHGPYDHSLSARRKHARTLSDTRARIPYSFSHARAFLTRQIHDVFEVGFEEGALVTLDFAVLDGLVLVKRVQLHRFVGGCAVLVLDRGDGVMWL